MWLIIPLLIILGLITYQDFKHRAVSWMLFPVGFILSVAYLLNNYHWRIIASNFSLNFIIICLQMLLLTVFFAIKNRKLSFIINRYIGIGDILFFVILCLFFSPVNFIMFLISSLLLILIIFGLIQMIKKIKQIPLAGCIALLLALLLGLNKLISSFDFYTDLPLINLLSIYG